MTTLPNGQPQTETILDHRRAGVLLHPTSLPGAFKQGDIGQEARNFLHFMADSGLSVWQMLPIGPTHEDGSPYQCLSAHAGNPELINLDWLIENQWLKQSELDNFYLGSSKNTLLETAAGRFFAQGSAQWLTRFNLFTEQNSDWLPDYALFMVLKKAHQNSAWMDWPEAIKSRDPAALAEAVERCAEAITTIEFIQFVFFTQWHELREYAQKLDIKLFGDMPIFVSMDSADVWSRKDNFLMDANGNCEFVAGVPPDAFSDLGQRWGNPLFNWDNMQAQGFSWWISRFKTQLELFDFIRLDHFRGLEACWHIPATSESAVHGHWEPSPGEKLLQRLHDHFHQLPLIAEDLGLITAPVRALRDQFNLPGMVILQFAFDAQNDNLYLPHNHHHNSVVYSGTHDNDTTLGWYQSLDIVAKTQCHEYLGHNPNGALDMPWAFNRLALSSVAQLAILPMQDLLSLDSNHRMNTPGTMQGNWQWRFKWKQVWPGLATDLAKLVRLYGRHPD